MAFSTCSSFRKRPPALMLLISELVFFGALLSTSTSLATSSNDFSTTLSSKTMQVRLVQALKQEGRYSAAAMFLGAVDLNHVLPESSTILVPMDEGVAESGLEFSTFNTAMPILQYHVIVQRLVFHELQQLAVGRTLPTLLLNNTVIITSNSSSNFTIDDVPMSRRNLFVASSTVVHGMNGVLNPALYGSMTRLPDVPEPSASPPGAFGGDSDGSSPIPGPFASNNHGNDTDASPFMPPGASPFMPPGSETLPPSSMPALQGGNPSSSPLSSDSLPSPSATHHLNGHPASPTKMPTSPGQQSSSPFLQSSCAGGFSASASCYSFLSLIAALLFSIIYLIAGFYELQRLPVLFCIMILPITATLCSATGPNDWAEILKTTGEFDYAATFLGAIDLHRLLPTGSTVLLPTDAAIEATGLIYNTLGNALPILQYHVITRELSFNDLQMLPTGETLETLLPKASVLVTSNEPWNFTLNDVLLSHPDLLCLNGSPMHGISGVMNYSQLSGITPLPTSGQLPVLSPPSPPLNLPLPEAAEPALPNPVSLANRLAAYKMIGSRYGIILLSYLTSIYS